MPLAAVQKFTEPPRPDQLPGASRSRAACATATRTSDAARPALQPYLHSPAGRQLLGIGDTRRRRARRSSKTPSTKRETDGNIFTTFFLVLGLFSIAAGMMLIFMIFVMLAAERKAEMGMARAVGAQRGNLVQSFVSEGMAYTLAGRPVGALLGVGCGGRRWSSASSKLAGDSLVRHRARDPALAHRQLLPAAS